MAADWVPVKPRTMTMGGVTVKVRVDSKDAPVYKAEATIVPKGMKGYTESTAGKRFTVHVKSSCPTDLAAILYVDGERVSNCALAGADPPREWKHFMGQESSEATIRAFVFEPLSLTDDAEIAITDEAIIKNMGSIKLSICRVVLISRSPTRKYQTDFGGVARKVLHEQSKKATLSHAAGLGATEAAAAGEYFLEVDYIDNPTDPWLTFEFAYRSRDLFPPSSHTHDVLADPFLQQICWRSRELCQVRYAFEASNHVTVLTITLYLDPVPIPAAVPSDTANQAGKKRRASRDINIDSDNDNNQDPKAVPEIIIIDSDDEDDGETQEQELLRLREEIAILKKVKLESEVKEGKAVKKKAKSSSKRKAAKKTTPPTNVELQATVKDEEDVKT